MRTFHKALFPRAHTHTHLQATILVPPPTRTKNTDARTHNKTWIKHSCRLTAFYISITQHFLVGIPAGRSCPTSGTWICHRTFLHWTCWIVFFCQGLDFHNRGKGNTEENTRKTKGKLKKTNKIYTIQGLVFYLNNSWLKQAVQDISIGFPAGKSCTPLEILQNSSAGSSHRKVLQSTVHDLQDPGDPCTFRQVLPSGC